MLNKVLKDEFFWASHVFAKSFGLKGLQGPILFPLMTDGMAASAQAATLATADGRD